MCPCKQRKLYGRRRFSGAMLEAALWAIPLAERRPEPRYLSLRTLSARAFERRKWAAAMHTKTLPQISSKTVLISEKCPRKENTNHAPSAWKWNIPILICEMHVRISLRHRCTCQDTPPLVATIAPAEYQGNVFLAFLAIELMLLPNSPTRERKLIPNERNFVISIFLTACWNKSSIFPDALFSRVIPNMSDSLSGSSHWPASFLAYTSCAWWFCLRLSFGYVPVTAFLALLFGLALASKISLPFLHLLHFCPLTEVSQGCHC